MILDKNATDNVLLVLRSLPNNADLMRTILLILEASPLPKLPFHPVIPGYSDRDVYMHLRLLRSFGLIHVKGISEGDNGKEFLGITPSMQGYDFLAVTRDEATWNSLKEIARAPHPSFY